ncbi:MAG: MFS transporter [Pseudomonadota bacterium]
MSLRIAFHTSRAPASALAAIGFVWGSTAAMMPQIQAAAGINDGTLGAVLFLAAIGSVAAMGAAPAFGDWAPRLSLPLSGIALALSLGFLGLSTASLWVLALALICVGLSTGLLDILGNARVAMLEAETDLRLMNLNHGTYSLSYAGAAVATGLARDAGLSISLWFGVMMVAALFMVPLMALDSAAPSKRDSYEGGTTGGRGPIGTMAILAGCVAMMSFFAENATEHWSALHIERTLGQGAALGALGPAMLGLTMGLGRFAGHFLTLPGRETALMRVAALVASFGLMLAALAPVVWMAYLGFALLGLGVSVVAPLALSLAGQTASAELRARAVARAAMISYFGFFMGPPLMGFLAQAAGLRVAFGFAALALLVVPLLLLPMMQRRL